MSSFTRLGVASHLATKLRWLRVQTPTTLQSSILPTLTQMAPTATAHPSLSSNASPSPPSSSPPSGDVILTGQPGEGKTLGYLLPILNTIDNAGPGIQSIILTPHPESALQVAHVARTLSKGGSKARRASPVVVGELVRVSPRLPRSLGGAPGSSGAARGAFVATTPLPHILVSTPDALSAAMEASPAFASAAMGVLSSLVLDEVDYLAAFERPNLSAILNAATIPARYAKSYARPKGNDRSRVPRKAAAPWMIGVTATNSPAVDQLVHQYFDPNVVELGTSDDSIVDLGLAHPVHHSCLLLPGHKEHSGRKRGAPGGVDLDVAAAAVAKASSDLGVSRGLIYTHNAGEGRAVDAALQARGFRSAWLPPYPTRAGSDTRKRMMSAFSRGALQFLVAPDVVTRGIDIPSLSAVFSVGIPSNVDQFVHRAGRVGRPSQAEQSPHVVSLIRSSRDLAAYDHICSQLSLHPTVKVL